MLLSGLEASEDALVVGNEYEILFTVEVSGTCDEVMLCDSNQQITSMNDSGQDGDLTAGDGIYSATLLINTGEQEEQLQLYAKADTAISEMVEIYVFDMPTQQEAQQTEQFIAALQEMQFSYSEDGYIPQEQLENLLNQAETFADVYKRQEEKCYERRQKRMTFPFPLFLFFRESGVENLAVLGAGRPGISLIRGGCWFR